jgi:hypothetical protein
VTEPRIPEPDTKDWTFVITQGCPECGFAPQPVERTGARLLATLPAWTAALARADAGQRPAPQVWSPVEYACHVRDVCALFRERLELMLTRDDPEFADWDQDAAALTGDYYHQDPRAVLDELTAQAQATARAFDAVIGDQWDRPGRRSNGARFTVRTFAVYFLHDVEHHVWDISCSPAPPAEDHNTCA